MRVALKTKNKGVKRATYPCRKCAEPIVAGQQYYEWKHRHAEPSRQHHSHGAPRQSELCTGKMSGVYAAIEGVEDVIAAGRTADDPSGLADALTNAAEEVRQVKEEYEEGLSNMPDSLQSSSTGEQIQEKIDALEEFADALDNAATDSEIVDWDMDTERPEPGAEHDSDCAAEQDEPGDCDCGYDELEAQRDEWETEQVEKIEAAFEHAENVLGELSI